MLILKIVAFILSSLCVAFCLSGLGILIYSSIRRNSWKEIIENTNALKKKNKPTVNKKEKTKLPSAEDFAYYLTSIMKINKLKLNALLYYIQAASLVRYKKKAFNDSIICGLFSPEIPSINNRIIERKEIVKCKGKYNKLSLLDVHLADLVMGCFGDLSSTELIAIIHSEYPWQLVYNSSSFNFEISTDEMQEYYKNVFEFKT